MQAVRWLGTGLVCGVAVAACSAGSSKPVGPSTVTANVGLAAGEYGLYAGSQVAGRVRFPAASAATQYLLVGQFATATTDLSASIAVSVGAVPVADIAARPGRLALLEAPAGAPTIASRFHDMLRRREAEMARAAASLPAAPRAARVAATPPVLGSTRSFKVCSSIQCTSLATITATALYVGSHAAIYQDTAEPAGGGFSQTDINAIGAEFDQTLWAIDHDAFGAESDIDNNGVVIILLTPKINALVPSPACNTSFVTGFFYGADIAPGLAASHNNGEVFYAMVPDPNGAIACRYSTAYVRAIIPVTFIHEFQHMISFNQHVLVRGSFSTEVLWLNEAMSHLAEEMGGLHFDSAGQDSVGSHFLSGDFYNGYVYLRNPSANVMVTDSPPGNLESRGGEWLFLRYLVDQYGGLQATQRLEQTSSTGAANVAALTGETFPTLLGRWALAVYASDLDSVQPGFTAPSLLTYHTWSFRTTYASLHNQVPSVFQVPFPLTPAAGSSATGVNVTGTLTSGSGTYVLVSQAAGAPAFDVTFLQASGAPLPSNAGGQLAVLRTQ